MSSHFNDRAKKPFIRYAHFNCLRLLHQLFVIAILLCPFLFGFFAYQTAWAQDAHFDHSTSVSTSFSIKQSEAKKPGKAKNGNGGQGANGGNGAAGGNGTAGGKGGKGAKKKNAVSPLKFPCSDRHVQGGKTAPNISALQGDWLTGNAPGPNAGHLVFTYAEDTYALPQITSLFGFMEGIGFLLVTPSLILLGYQVMLGASFFRYAGALEGLSSIVLAVIAVAVSFSLVQMLITFENTITGAIVFLHKAHPYPVAQVNGLPIPYMLPGTSADSYAGIVVPISRWGCSANQMVGLLSRSFLKDTLGSVVPIFGGFARLTGKVKNLLDLIQRIGEAVQAILSFLLWGQLFLRILFLNYYILSAPIAFGCWGLPGKVGQNVVRLWFRGFITVLSIQIVQLFILTTLPLLLPSLPQVPLKSDLLEGVLLEFPPILTLTLALLTPRLLGASMEKVLSTAGSVAGGAVAAVGMRS